MKNQNFLCALYAELIPHFDRLEALLWECDSHTEYEQCLDDYRESRADEMAYDNYSGARSMLVEELAEAAELSLTMADRALSILREDEADMAMLR